LSIGRERLCKVVAFTRRRSGRKVAMGADQSRLPLLEQREIEARIVGPLVWAFAEEVGEERALAIVGRVIRNLARESGAELARLVGDQSLAAFTQTLNRWRENGALELEVLEQTPVRLSFNVTRCRYAEMYHALGLPELGAGLSCQRDYALAQGFNPAIELTRTQTIMEGAPFCDFRFRLAGSSVSGPGTAVPPGNGEDEGASEPDPPASGPSQPES
jgi:L-2-amino-thiazoline-4-carboxylic acid hydrolase